MEATFAEARSCYEKASQLGKKEAGSPAILDEILRNIGMKTPRELPLGIQDIVLEQIVGTKTEGRKNCFSKNFYPIMKPDTEFAGKWIALCHSHLEEGIHTPIQVYEYMNEYYVLEGNKRVSVSKYFDTYSIAADVIRILPPLEDTPETRLYYEYLDFYSLSKINYLSFTKIGSFSKLQHLVEKERNESWSEDEVLDFNSVFTRFRIEYTKLMGKHPLKTICDAFLAFITVFDYRSLVDIPTSELKKKLRKFESEFALLLTPEPTTLQMDPFDKKPGIIKTLVPKVLTKQKVAFIHAKNPEHSGWTFTHDAGRRYMEKAFPDEVSATVYYDITEENIGATLETAIRTKHQVIFTTSPIFLKETLRAAVEHPEIKFLNCTPKLSYKHVRTYYPRMYEVKFLLGAIAGSMTSNDKIGYVADYPILGAVSNINAFALGAKMVNPRAQIFLKWSKKQSDTMEDIYNGFKEQNINVICDRDTQNQNVYPDRIGLYMVHDDGVWNMALPIWNWSIFYEKTLSNIINGNWKAEESHEKTKGLRYWWGISSDLINILHSTRLPMGTVRLIELLKQSITQGGFHPFTGVLYSQDREIQSDPYATLSPEEILEMDWLADNVIGSIPEKTTLTNQAKTVANYAGVDKNAQLI